MKRWLLLLLLALSADAGIVVQSGPRCFNCQSGGASGLVNGESLVISGSGFGTKTNVAPFVFENGESGTVGQQPGSPWSYDYDPPTQYQPQYSNSQAFGGSKSIYYGMGDKAGASDNVMMLQGNWSEVYLSYRVRLVENAEGSNTQIKMARLMGFSAANPYTASPGIHPIFWLSGAPAGNFYIDCLGLGSNDNAYYSQGTVPNLTGSIWNRHEIYSRLGSAGTANGNRWHAINDFDSFQQGSGSGLVNGEFANATAGQTTYAHRSGSTVTLGSSTDSNYIAKIMMPFYCTADGCDLDVWLDEIFVQVGADAQKRIEIGNASTFYGSTRRSPQPATAWSDASVTVTLNQGNQQCGDTAYGFAVSSDGAIANLGELGTWSC